MAVTLPRAKLRAFAGPLFAAVIFALAMRLLLHEVTEHWDQFVAGLTGVPPRYFGFAAVLVVMNYGLYITYDLLALRYLCRSLPLRRVALASFLGYSLGNNLGTLLASAPLRFRFYGRWGLSARQIIVMISILGLTFWSGVWFLGGTVLVLVPIDLPSEVQLPLGTRALGWILLSLAIGYLVVCFVWHKPWPIGRLHLRPPEPGLMAVQASVAAVDLLISATALYLVLPGDAVVPFATVLAAFLAGIAISMMTQVPGGLGVLELILLKLLRDSVGDSVLASALIFRVIYYLLPMILGMILLVGHELYRGAVEAREARESR
jgi:uncharacterized membrane protein YbhN (UPF0104 family)